MIEAEPLRALPSGKRVLHLIDTLWLGGAQRLVKNLFESQQQNEDMFLYVLRRTTPSYTVDHPNVLGYPSGSKYSLAPLGDVARCIARFEIDVLHCHLCRAIAFGCLIKQLYCKGIKLIIQDHAEVANRRWLFDIVMRYSRRHAAAYVASSLANKEMVDGLLHLRDGRTRVVYNYADPERFNVQLARHHRDGARAELGIGNEDFVVGYAGRISLRKGWQLFVRAAEILREEPMIFVIAGAGPGEERLKEFVRVRGLEEKIRFLGYRADVARFYAMLDCYVLPSLWEGMPMTLLEAMSMGVPAVCSRAAGIEEFVSDTKDALLIDPVEPTDLARKLRRLLEHPALRQHLSANARDTVSRYNSARLVSELSYVYSNAPE